MQKKVNRGVAFVVILMSRFNEIRGSQGNPRGVSTRQTPTPPRPKRLADIEILLLDPHIEP